MKLCPKCGTAICEDEESCSFCGEKIPDVSPVIKTDESKKNTDYSSFTGNIFR